MDWLISMIVAFGFVAAILVVAWAFAPKGWRTVVANTLAAVGVTIGPLLEHLASVPWHEVMDKKTAFLIVLAVNAMNILLRKLTDSPMGVK